MGYLVLQAIYILIFVSIIYLIKEKIGLNHMGKNNAQMTIENLSDNDCICLYRNL